MAQLLDGKLVSARILKSLASLPRRKTPGLATILVGNRPDSAKYVAAKHKACEKVGIESFSVELPDVSGLAQSIKDLNNDDRVDGVLLQLPLPEGSRHQQESFLRQILPEKDVDGFHPENLGRLCRHGEAVRHQEHDEEPFPRPCTPSGILEMLRFYKIGLEGKHCVILGRSTIVGLPLALLMTHENATVTIAHSCSSNIPELCREADVLVAAIGQARHVKGDWVKPGAVVVDVGMNIDQAGTLCGDVDFDSAAERASFISPVPGGVGRMTVAMLMKNTVECANRRATIK